MEKKLGHTVLQILGIGKIYVTAMGRGFHRDVDLLSATLPSGWYLRAEESEHQQNSNSCPLMRYTSGEELLTEGGHIPSSCQEKSEKEERNGQMLTKQNSKGAKINKDSRRKMGEIDT